MPDTRSFIPRVAFTGLLAITFTGCGLAQSAAENAVESVVESAIEADSGEEIDLDFGSDGLSLNTDEGSIEFDAETGEFVLVDDTGEVISGNIDLDENGINVESSEGSLTIDESGEFEVLDEDGNQVADGGVDEDGNFDATFETDEGEGTFSTGTEVPEKWPSDVLAIYPNSTVLSASEFDAGEAILLSVVVETTDSVADVYDFYDAETQGWSGQRTQQDNDVFIVVSNDVYTAQITASEVGDETQISVTISETPE